jgi:hypothetical protein
VRPEVIRKSGGTTIGDRGIWHDTPRNEASLLRRALIQVEKHSRSEKERKAGVLVTRDTAMRETGQIVQGVDGPFLFNRDSSAEISVVILEKSVVVPEGYSFVIMIDFAARL